MQIIPFKEPASWQQQITLTGTIFNLRFKWNALNKFWAMSIFDRNDNPIVYGIKVVIDWDLTSQYVTDGMPAGEITCQSTLGLVQVTLPNGEIVFENSIASFREIERFDMGRSAELFYYEPGELETLTS
jgi:hypothetical protein